jgi:membrane-bound lytic murein transglycosylase F
VISKKTIALSSFSVLGLVGLSLFLHSCHSGPSLLDEIQKQGTLVVVTRNAPTTYYELHDQYEGLEHDMATAFADSLGVKVKFVVKDTTAEILSAIEHGQAHVAAAGLTKTEARADKFRFGPTYQQVKQQVVCRRGGKHPKGVDDLTDVQLVVAAKTSYVERLKQLKQDHPQLEWQAVDNIDSETLLEQVWRKKIDCTVADSTIVSINRRYFPELRVRFDLTEPEGLAWALPSGAGELNARLYGWFSKYKAAGKLDKLIERYYGFIEVFDYVDTRRFVRRIRTVLPKYKSLFKSAAQKHDLDWTLLAAQAYQESHWRPRAKSPTGVRGIMMLTLTTAREVGIKSRLNPKQSIDGGALYLSRLLERIPDEVPQPDRTWFALAAYNVGMGHIYDARDLAEQLGRNPNLWHEMEEVLPLLTQKRYYRKVKHGYARGHEPVIYVNRIRDYRDLLLNHLERQ